MAIKAGGVVRLLYALVLAASGLALLAGGAHLVSLGGSAYYALCGAVLIGIAALTAFRHRLARPLYATVLVFTAAWAFWEAGLDGWALLPRLAFFLVLGLGFLLPGVSNRTGHQKGKTARAGWGVFLASFALAAPIGSWLGTTRGDNKPDPIYQAGVSGALPEKVSKASSLTTTSDGRDWRNYGNDPGGSRFSPLDQIDKDNVGQLEVAWTAHLGRVPGRAEGSLQVTPLKIGNTLYVCTGLNDVIALDAETGRTNWRFDSRIAPGTYAIHACRGVAYFEKPGDGRGPCAKRVITNTLDARLIALDALTGKPCTDFGDGGQVDLMEGLGTHEPGYYFVSSAPTLVRGKIVLGGGVADGLLWGEPSGVIRAFDAITGKLAWAFDVGRLDRQGPPPPGETYTDSTPNSWAPMSADPDLGLVFAPTGNATPDYYGGNRRDFDDRFSSSVVAIDAETGKLRWFFQTAHHDIWDYDVAAQPGLVDIATPAGVRKALVQATKRGEIFVLDRQTGEPIFPIEERTVPQGGLVAGERLASTQPFSEALPAFGGATWQERDMWGLTPFDQLWCRTAFKEHRYEGRMTPPGVRTAIAHPGFMGGIDWGSVAVDRDRDVMIVNSNRMGTVITLIERRVADAMGIKRSAGKAKIGLNMPQEGTPYAATAAGFLSPLGVPCNEPPFGKVSAVNLRTGKLIWTRPLGSARDSGPMGIPSMLPLSMGLPNTGGSLITRSGIVFIAAAQERALRALDEATGKTLWSARLPAGGQASPMTYWSNKSKRQFVVIAAGGNIPLQSKTGDALVAFALPQ
ncbi:membrane-bound PQQ-dependent dehydrogenase, glucose/quinate/shikimate family [Novosphingobium malaysiense]|uniref:Pyrrolo-quinoline quinone repeat domain-containing protein n=1 Tax=Novosphingobium malaysiense TaxID=1348853 RepID=A0A0B1ZHR7_9SPHN|nr:membrane-bound PQQ-dependent dehydrogenase, glucose/quinate/shikimate family [Novosphingobium malaysiense]KHK90042.1 hypothetical protein LK12_17960 [Novosphingobium malaysiense]